MGANIDVFKRSSEYISKKNQKGNTLTVSQFNEMAHRAQMQAFEKDRAVFIAQKELSDYLKTFLKSKTYSLNSLFGELTFPSDLEHVVNVRSYHIKNDGAGMEVPMDEVKGADWSAITSSSLFAASSRFPKYSEFGDTLRFLPRNLTSITIDYLKTPVAPVWAYTTVNNRPVYNAANSVDFEWGDYAMNEVMAIFLSYVGVNLKDVELSVFAQNFKQEANSII